MRALPTHRASGGPGSGVLPYPYADSLATPLAELRGACYCWRMADRTALFRLVDAKLGEQSLVDLLRDARAANQSFQMIGYELAKLTGEQVTQETIRTWVRSLEETGELVPTYLPGHRREKPAA